MTEQAGRTARGAGGAGLVVLMGIAAAVLPATASSAHDDLVGSTPASGESVSQLTTVDLEFSSTLLQLGDEANRDEANRAEVTDASGLHYETACAEVDDTELHLPVALGDAGQYTVTYKVVSSDGHAVSGSYGFDYAPADGVQATPGTEQSACAGGSTPAMSQSPDQPADESAAQSPDSGGAEYSWAIGLAAAIGVLAVVIAVVALLVARRRDRDEDTPRQAGPPGR